LRVKNGFWGHKILSHNKSGRTEAEIMPCPTGYCCDDDDTGTGCNWDNDDACKGHRDHTQPMCGGCKQDFSQSIDGTGCISDGECNGRKVSIYYYMLQQLGFW
jgi:hypothetical protein